MRARRLQRLSVPSEDDVPERDRVGTPSQRNQVRERPTEQGAVRFYDAVNQRGVATPEQNECQDEAEKCCRAGPEISQDAVHGSL